MTYYMKQICDEIEELERQPLTMQSLATMAALLTIKKDMLKIELMEAEFEDDEQAPVAKTTAKPAQSYFGK